MTDVLDRDERRVAPAHWHPSMGAPPGLRSPVAHADPTTTRRSGAPAELHWHPSAGAPGSALESGRTADADSAPPRSHRRKVRTGPPRRRALLLIIATAIALATLAARLVQVQLLDRETYAALGERQGTAQWELESVRGAILDRNLNLLAVSQQPAHNLG